MIGQSGRKARSIRSCWPFGRALMSLGAPQELGALIGRFLVGEPSPALTLPQHPLLGLDVITDQLSFELPRGMRRGVKTEARPVFRRKIIMGRPGIGTRRGVLGRRGLAIMGKWRLWAWGPLAGVGIEAGCQSGGVGPHGAPLFRFDLHLSIMFKPRTLAIGSAWSLGAGVHPRMGRKLTPRFRGGLRIGVLLGTVARAIVGQRTSPRRQGTWTPRSIRLRGHSLGSPVSQTVSRREVHVWVQATAYHGSRPNFRLLLQPSGIHSNVFSDAGGLW